MVIYSTFIIQVVIQIIASSPRRIRQEIEKHSRTLKRMLNRRS